MKTGVTHSPLALCWGINTQQQARPDFYCRHAQIHLPAHLWSFCGGPALTAQSGDAGLKGTVLQKVLEKKAQALKAPTAPPPPPPVQLQPQQQQLLQQQQKTLPMQMTGMHLALFSAFGMCKPA